MAQQIKLKRSAVAGRIPTTSSLDLGEIAVNTADGKLYFQRGDSTIQSFFTTNALITGSLQQSGSDSYFLSNVGIGTATPSSKLHVSGGADVMLIEGSGSTANTSIFAIDGNNGRLFEVSDDLSDSLFSVNTIAGLPVVEVFSDNRVIMGAFNQNDLVISGSRVGIGTATPSAKLDVIGDVKITGSLDMSGSINVTGDQREINILGDDGQVALKLNDTLAGATDSGKIGWYIDGTLYGSITATGASPTDGLIIRSEPNRAITFKTNGNFDRMIIQQDGNVGIGNNTPTEPLTVEGNISASGNLYLDGAIFDSSDTSGSLGQVLTSIAGGTAWEDIDTAVLDEVENIYATVKNVSGVTLYKGTPVHAVSGSSSGQVNPVIAASASDATTMPATFILNQDINDEAEGQAIIAGHIEGVDTSLFNVGDIVYVGESGGYTNVKPTGSANLIQNLGVVTKVHASNGSGVIYGSGRSNDVPNLPVGKIWVGSDSYSVTSSLVHLDEANGRLGIGTTSPGSPLTVAGRVDFQNDLRLRGTDSAANQGVTRFFVDSNNKLHIDTANNGNNVFTIDSSGNVGINSTITSGYRLYVNGSTWINGGTNFQDGVSIFRTQSGAAEVMRIASNGNVGIGTTSPVGILHAYSTSAPVIESPSNAAIIIRRNDNVGYSSLLKYHSGNTEKYVAGLSDSGDYTGSTGEEYIIGTTKTNPLIVLKNDGKLGIGTTTPAYRLDVSGSGNFTDNLTVTGSVKFLDSDSLLTIEDGGSLLTDIKSNYNQLNFRPNGNQALVLNLAGHTSVSRTLSVGRLLAPAASANYQLDVSGSGNFTDGLTVTGSALIQGVGNYADTNLQIVNASGDNILKAINGHSITVGISNNNSIVVGNGAHVISSSTTKGLNFYSNTQNGFNFELLGLGSVVRIDNNTGTRGFMGLGTTAPQHRLDVSGSGNFTDGLTVTGSILHDGDLTVTGTVTAQEFHTEFVSASIVYSSGSTKFGDTADDTHSFTGSLKVTGSARFENGSKLVFKSTGNTYGAQHYMNEYNYTIEPEGGYGLTRFHVKTGASDYLLQLTVGTSILADTTNGFIFNQNVFAPYDGAYGFRTYGTTNAAKVMELFDRDDNSNHGVKLLYQSGSTYVDGFAMDNRGNVGIGTTSPAYTLDVNGRIRTSQDLYLDGNYVIKNISSHLYLDAASSRDIIFRPDNGTEKVRITSTGNVGIGTTSPTDKLDVSGNLKLVNTNDYIKFANDFVTIKRDGANFMSLNAYAGFKFYDTQASSERMRIDSSGNIGIGTTSPTTTLDVRGTISQVVDASANQYPLSFYNDHSGTDYYLLRQRVVNSGNQVRTGLGITGVPDAAFVIGPQTDQIFKFSTSGRIRNVQEILGTSTLEITGTDIRLGDGNNAQGGGIVNIVGASNKTPLLIQEESGTSQTRFITFLSSSGEEVLGITTDGGFRATTDTLIKRFSYSHAYGGSSVSDGQGVGISFITDDEGNNLRDIAYIDAVQDDISEDESSLRFSVGESTPTEVMRLQSDGNVGIGNSSPTHTVEIGTDGGGEKILKMHSDTASSYFEIQSLGNVARLLATNNTNLLLQSDGTGGYITFNANSAERMRIDSAGRLLLNATSTSFSDKLYINGDAYVNGGWRVGTSATYVGKLYNTSGILTLESDSTRDIQFGSVTNGTAMFIEGSNGNVGIGTTSPVYPLHINNGTGDQSALFESTDVTNTISIKDSNSTSINTTGIGVNGDDLFLYAGSTAYNQRLRIQGSTGNIGVGIAPPSTSQRFTVSGSANQWGVVSLRGMTDSLTPPSYYYGAGNAHNFTRPIITSNNISIFDGDSAISESGYRIGNNDGILNIGHVKAGVTLDSTVFNISASSVGIGTTTPETQLDITGDLTIGDRIYTRADGNRNTFIDSGTDRWTFYVANPILDLSLTEGAVFNEGGVSTMDFRVESDTNTHMLFVDAGNNRVGIGTTDPQTPLHVNGHISSSRLYTSDDVYVGNDLYVEGNLIRLTGTGTNYIQTTSGDLKIQTALGDDVIIRPGGTDHFTFKDSGRLGIGTTSPEVKLSVAGGKIQLENNQEITWSDIGDGTTGRVAIRGSEDGDFILFRTDGGERMRLSGPNLGIGTTTPTEILTVEGNISGSGNLVVEGAIEGASKSFNIPHPTQPGRKLIYGSLEGPEHGVYCRGKIEGNLIELPEEWTGLVDEDTITVQLTSIGSHQNLYVSDIKDNKVFIKNGNTFSSKIKAFYFIQAMRKDIDKLQTVR